VEEAVMDRHDLYVSRLEREEEERRERDEELDEELEEKREDARDRIAAFKGGGK
jgi:hypothetical protein